MRVYSFEVEEESSVNLDEVFMREAIKLANQAFEEDEIPIGAIVVSQGKIIGKGYNLTERLNDVTAHAEMQAFTAAANYMGGKYLKGCTLYVTVEPCVMCGGAAYWTQISRIVYGAKDAKRGYSNLNLKIIHPKTEVVSGVLEAECSVLMKDFFKNKR